jgi:hypothetical protein
MATNITNAQIVEALRLLGFPETLFQGLSLSGAQNTTFANRLRSAGIGGAIFERAKDVARFKADYKPSEWGERQGIETTNLLQTMGASPEQIQQVKDRAAELASSGTISAAGAPGYQYIYKGRQLTIPASAFTQATSDVLGQTFSSAITTVTGVAQPPSTATTPAMPGAAAPPAAPVATPARPGGGPRMQITGPAPPGKAQPGAAEPTIAQQVAAGITAGLGNIPKPKPATPAEIRAEVNSMYGWAAGLADIPEIAKILDDAAMGLITKTEVGNRFNATHYKRTTTEAARNWKILSTTTPGDAAAERQTRLAGITKLVTGIGTTMDPARLNHLVDLSLQNGWDETQISTFLANEIHYDPTKAKTGVLGSLKEAQRQYLVPLSDQAMSSWASAIVTGTQTPEQFDQYLRDSAASLFPALTEALKDPNMTTRKYLDSYGQVIGKTLGTNSEDIDWLDPKYQRFITQVDDKGARKVMPLADVQRTLMSDPLYKYDETTQGRQAKSAVSAGLLKTFGFTS